TTRSRRPRPGPSRTAPRRVSGTSSSKAGGATPSAAVSRRSISDFSRGTRGSSATTPDTPTTSSGMSSAAVPSTRTSSSSMRGKCSTGCSRSGAASTGSAWHEAKRHIMSLERVKRVLRDDASAATATRTVAEFAVHYTQYLDEHGRLVDDAPPLAHDLERLLELYRHMLLTRLFDRKAVALQRTGQLGTYASSLGQEAASVGIGAAMAREDVLLPTYRETGAMLLRGVLMRELLLYWGGDEAGSCYSGPNAPAEDFPICVPIATHAPHAVGVAHAFKLRREPRVAVCALGDGATSKGDFYEALNAAGVFELPLVFVIVNNQWAISVPRSLQSRADTLAQKAIAAGIEGE